MHKLSMLRQHVQSPAKSCTTASLSGTVAKATVLFLLDHSQQLMAIPQIVVRVL
jgi:hypothetical protein